MSSITATDSLIAFGRVYCISLQLPMRNTINIWLGDGSLLEMRRCVMTGDSIIACACLLSNKTINDKLDFHISWWPCEVIDLSTQKLTQVSVVVNYVQRRSKLIQWCHMVAITSSQYAVEDVGSQHDTVMLILPIGNFF